MWRKLIPVLPILVVVSCQKPVEEIATPERPEQQISVPQPSHFPNFRLTSADVANITRSGVQLGQRLFYDTTLSGNSGIACGTCHRQKKAFSDGHPVSIGAGGLMGHRNSMGLNNMLWVKEFMWDGRAVSLEEQILMPIQDHKEMDLALDSIAPRLQALPHYPPMFEAAFGTVEITPERTAKAIAQFIRTMVSNNSKYDKWRRGEVTLTDSELRGHNLFYRHPEPGKFRGGNCGDCHLGSLQDDVVFRNNGLDDVFLDNGRFNKTQKPSDIGKFRVPSLRNIALTAPYMHDGRFSTLEEVIEHYDQHVKWPAQTDPLMHASNLPLDFQITPRLYLTAGEKADIIAFLHTLTDYSFINDPRFGSPFHPEN